MLKHVSGLLANTERPVFYDNLDFSTKYYGKKSVIMHFYFMLFTPLLGVIFNIF